MDDVARDNPPDSAIETRIAKISWRRYRELTEPGVGEYVNRSGSENKEDQTGDYAWATVKVYKNGLVKITAYGFDDHYGRARALGSINLWQRLPGIARRGRSPIPEFQDYSR